MKKTWICMTLMMTLTIFAGCASAGAAQVDNAAPVPTEALRVEAEGTEQQPLETESLETAALVESEEESAMPENTIAMYVKPRTVTTEMEQVTVIIKNDTDKDYSMDYVQKLEMLVDGAWQEVPLTTDAASMALLVIPAGEMMDFVFDFAYHYEPLQRGTYRILKTFVDQEGNALESDCQFDMF